MHLHHAGRSFYFIMVEIELMHLQPFTDSHFHFITVQLSTSQVLFQSPKQIVCCMLPYYKCYLVLKNKMLH